MLKDKIEIAEKEALTAFKAAQNGKELYEAKVKHLGKQGAFSLLMREFGKLPPADKPAMGQLINEVKTRLEENYAQLEKELKLKAYDEIIKKEQLDLTLPGTKSADGARHPVSMVINEIVSILSRIGYSVRQGPLIETDRNNFTALNIPEDHPARDLQDTFYIDEGHVLRTHTSPVQIRTMESEAPPIRVLAPGSVFRCDSDISHSPNFHQIEGLLVDRKVSMADLKGTLTYFVQEFFSKDIKTRFRPSYFQFTEPSAEVDCSCPICKGKGCRMCKNSGWIEIGGCGLVNPKVLEHCKLDPEKWQGFAFGFGVERMAIIKYGVDEIKLFSENDVRFLKQFQF
ncbi:MAG: phenylalanine--tRNA ligase subunit alpha [Bdellovibrionales bacterium]|nr:phenylalanine--tRNA ligase subunit alpha [Bdellovibrionales bacterium]